MRISAAIYSFYKLNLFGEIMNYYVAAIDLGASSGRVILGEYNQEQKALSFQEIHRFSNQLNLINGHLCWDIDGLEKEIRLGLAKLCEQHPNLNSVGVDSWGVDFICIDKNGDRIAPSISYRDNRTCEVSHQLLDQIGKTSLYQQTGIQFQPFNTIFQLKAQSVQNEPWIDKIDKILLVPDYLQYRLTGQLHWEYTNASTTGLLAVEQRDWSPQLLKMADINPDWLGPISYPGSLVGYWSSPDGQDIPVMSPPTHDTASAVAATPLSHEHCAYISSGTWSLIGIECSRPCTSEQGRIANLTNEGAANKRYRILKNVMGMWLMEGVLKENPDLDIVKLLEQAKVQPLFTSMVDPNDPCFVHPDSMTQAIQEYCRKTSQAVPATAAALARCILDSLALSYRAAIRQIERVCDHPITEIRIVGGGSKNKLLNQLCADICQRPVYAGPDEASALGNIGYQLIGLNAIKDGQQLREIISQNFSQDSYIPQTCIGLEAACSRFNQLSTSPVEPVQTKELI